MKVLTILVFIFVLHFCESQERIRPLLLSSAHCNCIDNMIRKVCGKDGKTYNSKCQLNCAGVEMKYEGACRELFTGEGHHGHAHHKHLALSQQPRNNCGRDCPKSDKNKKICADDGAEYINECFMKCLSIKKDVKMLHEGRCYNNYMSQQHHGHKHLSLVPNVGTACLCVPAPLICASDGKTYEGVCVMKCFSLELNVHKVHDGACLPEKSKHLSNDPYPGMPCLCVPLPEICASDGKTYEGECVMKCYSFDPNVHKVHDGRCASDIVQCACPPGPKVCASDLKTYYGECNLKCAIRNGKRIFKLHDGACSPGDKVIDFIDPKKPVFCQCAPGPPVCASDGKTYDGDCNLQCAITNGKKILKMHDGACSPADKLKHQAIAPLAGTSCLCVPSPEICASDGKTYEGECVMKCYAFDPNVHKVHDGRCASDIVQCACPPGPKVCASDLKTYYGECNLKCAIRNGKRIFKLHDGACSPGDKVIDFIDPKKPVFCQCAPGPPVCASDGKTYDGDCNLQCAITNGKQIHKVHDGACN